MDAPADTLNYMIAGYAVIFISMAGYVASLILRWNGLRREEQYLESLTELEDGTDTVVVESLN